MSSKYFSTGINYGGMGLHPDLWGGNKSISFYKKRVVGHATNKTLREIKGDYKPTIKSLNMLQSLKWR